MRMILEQALGTRLMAGLMFILGASWGSFLALIIYRLPLGQSIVLPRSFCDSCQRPLRVWHNIPIISWLGLRGRCAYCSSPIGLRPLVIEILCALCMLALYLKLGLGIALVEKFGLFFILLGLSYIDMDYFSLPYSLLFALFFWGALSSIIYSFYPDAYVPLKDNFGIFSSLIKPNENFSLSSRLWASLVALIFFSLVNVSLTFWFRKSGRLTSEQWAMGWGDPLLLSGIGLFVGLSHLALVIFLASFIGSICGIALMIGGQKNEDKEIPQGAVPFGPFLSLAAIYIYLF